MFLVLFRFTGCIIHISDELIDQRTWLHENFGHLVKTEADDESILTKTPQLSLCSNISSTNNVSNTSEEATETENDHKDDI